MRETKKIRGKKKSHSEDRKPLKKEGTFQRQPHFPHLLTSLHIFYQATPIPSPHRSLLSLLLGTSCSTDPMTLERHRAWSSGCSSINAHSRDLSHFTSFKYHKLMTLIPSPDLPTLQTFRNNYLPDTFTLMNDRHLKLNILTHIPNCLPLPTNLFLPTIYLNHSALKPRCCS